MLVLSCTLFLLFLVLGSFLNVVAIRTLNGTSVLDPKHSHCPSCNTRLRWFELIPVLSWLLQRGRCRTCGAAVSWFYPLGELTTALILQFIVWHGGLTLETLVVLVLFLLVITVTLTDLRAMRMPNKIMLPGLLLLLVLRMLVSTEPLWFYLLGFLIGGGLLTLLAFLPNGMGGGDIKLFAGIGLALGPELVLLSFFCACLAGTLVGLPLRVVGWLQPKQPIPFGPFILIGTLTAWAWGVELVRWYLQLF